MLSSDLITLRPLGPQDRHLSDSLYGDERVTAGWSMEPLQGEALNHKFEQLIGEWARGGYSQFAIIENATGKEAGLGGIRPTETQGEGEIGYVLLPEAWGRGIASEAIRLWSAWGFQELRLKRIVADGVENPASIRALQKSGYTVYQEVKAEGRALLYLELLPG